MALGGYLTLFVFAVVSFLLFLNHTVWAVDATGLTLVVVSDDKADVAGDTGTSNGSVPVTGGQIVYRWGWTNVTGGTSTTFAQTLPVGVTWNAASIAAGCSVAGSYLTTGETLTCTINNLTDIPGTTDKTATVKNVANNTVLKTKLVSGSQESAEASLTAVGTSQVQTQITRGNASYMTDAKDPATGLVSGLQVPFSMVLYVPGTMADQIKGQEGLGSSYGFSYTVTVPANAQLIACGTDNTFQHDSSAATLPSFGAGASTATNRAANSGTMSCTQNGTTVTVTFAGVDARLNHVPTNNANYYPSKGIFALGGIKIWMPGTNFSSSSSTSVSMTVNPANFTSASGIASTSPTASTNYPIQLPAFTLNQAAASAGSSPPYPRGNYTQSTQLSVPSGSGQSATNAQLCMVWDPTLQKVRGDINPLTVSSTNVTPSAAVGNFTIEYGTASYADDAARRAADCGSVGDNAASWFSTVAEAGGPSEVSAVRVRYNRALDPGQFITINIAVSAPTEQGLLPTAGNPTGITYLQYFNNRKSDQTSVVRTGTYSARNSFSNASVRNAVTFASSDVKPGASTNVSLQPTVSTGTTGFTDGRQALSVTETVTLPNGCYTFVPGSPAPVSVTPLTPAVPTGQQTCADVAGQVIVWNLGNVTTGVSVPPITFALNTNPGTPVPSIATISAVISSNSDKATGSSRTSTDTINVNTVNQFQVSLNASSNNVNTGIPVTYRVGWNNASSSNLAGAAYVVDVLPFVGDGRGTAGLGGLTVNSVTTSPGSLGVEYTTDAAVSVMSALAVDQTGSSGISWTNTQPGSGITAIRIRTQELTAWQSGYADISVTPQSFAKGGQMNNSLYAKADDLSSGFSNVEGLALHSASSTVEGSVYKDVDYSGAKNAGDIDIQNATVELSGYNFGPNGINNGGTGDDIAVTLSEVTASNGSYSFTVSPGVYTLSAASTQTVNETTNNLIVQPSANFEVSGAITVTNKSFGYQEPINPPLAVADSRTINQGQSVTISILDNDTTYVPAGVPATTVGGLTSPARGTAILNGDNTITYTANSVWPGSVPGLTYTATFDYTLTNPQGSSTATVTVTVKRLPFGTTDVQAIPDNQTVDIDALANDFGDRIAFDASVPPTTNGSGAVSVVAGKLRFVPATRAWGASETSYTETLTYHINDFEDNTASGQAVITVYRAPVVTNDSKTITYNTADIITVLANDLVGRSPATVGIVTPPSNGTAAVVNNEVTFTPASGQTGTVNLTYRVTDGLGQTGTGTVTITVANEFTVANDGSVGTPLRTAQSGRLVNVLANDTGSSLTITAVGTPSHGTAAVNAGQIQYAPTNGYSGTDTFTYTVRDVLNVTRTATVYLRVIAAPTATNDVAWTDTATTLDVDVLANDTYDASAVLSIVTPPSQGSMSVQAGKLRFVPPAAPASSVTVTYRITDDVGQTTTATLMLTVVRVFTVNNDGSIGSPINVAAAGRAITVLANDTGSDINVTSVGAAGHGTVTNNSGTLQYVPAAGYDGADNFTYSVTDAVGTVKSATVYLNVIAVPVLTADVTTTDSDTSLDIDVRANDVADSSAIVAITAAPSHGVASIVSGRIVYVPEANYDGVVTVGYSLTDVMAQSASSTLTITVTAAFIARDDGTLQAPISVYEEGKTIAVLDNDSGTSLSVTQVTAATNGTVSIATDGKTLSYVPNDGYIGQDSFDYTITDAHAQTSTARVYISVTNKPVVVTPPTPAKPAEEASVPAPRLPITPAAPVEEPSTDNVPAQPTGGQAGGESILLNDFDTYFNTGKQLTLAGNQIIHFNIEKPEQTENHTVTIARVGDKYVDIIIRSDPITARLAIGEMRQFDVNKDGQNDIEITLLSIVDGQAEMNFTQLEQPAAVVSSERSTWQWWWIVIGFAVLVISYGIYRKVKKNSAN